MAIQQHTIDTPYMVGPVHCYTADNDGGIILFDTGPPTERAEEYLRENIDLARLKYVFITHCHIDHYGMLHWLEKETDAQLYLPYRDSLKILNHEERLRRMYLILEELGFSGEYLGKLHSTITSGRIFPTLPKEFSIVEEKMPDNLGLNYVCCPAHSQSDIVYYNNDWAVTGDVLLKGIFQSPLLDVDLETGKRFNNYKAYCSSLRNLALLRGKRIYPAHREVIENVDEIILFYVTKMLGRVRHLGRIENDRNVASMIDEMFGEGLKDPFHVYLKASEVVFMLDFLNEPHLLKEAMEDIELFDKIAAAHEVAVTLRRE